MHEIPLGTREEEHFPSGMIQILNIGNALKVLIQKGDIGISLHVGIGLIDIRRE